MSHQVALAEETGAMLRSVKDLRGYRVVAEDEDVGKLVDIYFDDLEWNVRHLVVQTGSWLRRRKVLLSPHVAGHPDGERQVLPVRLARERVKSAPLFDVNRPVSREQQLELYTYYGWPASWLGTALPGTMIPSVDPPGGPDPREGENHLRSTREILGYKVDAVDGDMGHVEDFIVEEESWIVRYLVVDTRNWLPARKVLVAPTWVDDIRWRDRRFRVTMTREQIESSPPYDPEAPINREYELRLYDYYGRPKQWAS